MNSSCFIFVFCVSHCWKISLVSSGRFSYPNLHYHLIHIYKSKSTEINSNLRTVSTALLATTDFR